MRSFAMVRYLLVPLHWSSLLSILCFAVSLTFAEHGGVLGITIFLGTSLFLVCYAFALLDHTLEGRAQPLVLSIDVGTAFAAPAIGTFIALALFYYATYRLQPALNPYVTAALRLVLVALLPAMLGIMAITGRFLAAFNPHAVFGTVARIPAAYATLVLVIGVLWAGPLILVHMSSFSFSVLWRVESFLPLGMLSVIGLKGLLIGLAGHIVLTYLLLATFACIGGTLYESRWELDIQPAQAPERKIERANVELERQRDRLADQLHAELRAGPFSRVRASAQKLISEASQPVEECRWLYARTAKWSDQRLADHLARLLLPLLLTRRANGQALDIARERLETSPDFRPETSAQLLRLVQLACAAGDRATARRLLVDSRRHYGSGPMTDRLAQLQRELHQ